MKSLFKNEDNFFIFKLEKWVKGINAKVDEKNKMKMSTYSNLGSSLIRINLAIMIVSDSIKVIPTTPLNNFFLSILWYNNSAPLPMIKAAGTTDTI